MPEHLTLNQLAAIADEGPVAGSAAATHLAGCGECRRELDTLRRLRASVAALPGREPPADQWERLAARHRFGRVRWFQRPGVLRLAAAFVLVFGGGLLAGVEISRSGSHGPAVGLPPGLSALPPALDTLPPAPRSHQENPVLHDLKLIIIAAVAAAIAMGVYAYFKGPKKPGAPPQ